MIFEGDCLEIMPTLEDKSVDMILCDLPYGTTACKWDTIIPFEPLWTQYKRLIKDNGAIVLTASQPFTSALVMSNPEMFKHEWVWIKNRGSNFANTVREPFKEHESVLVFAYGKWTYHKQMQNRTGGGVGLIGKSIRGQTTPTDNYGNFTGWKTESLSELRIPSSWQKFNTEVGLHPTQKPVALFEYLIRTYTNEGDTVLDSCAGSGTTGVACLNTNRKFILIEKDAGYCEIIRKRLDNHSPLFTNHPIGAE
jgi:site-specific DNA-methyltransferase (adenine-specific)